MRARVFLIAALVLVLCGTGAVAWVAAKDDDPQPTALAPGSPSDPEGDPAPAPTAPEPQQTEPQQPDQVPIPTDTGSAPAPQEPTSPEPAQGGGQKTHFKPEKKSKVPNDEPDRKFAVPPAQQFSGEGNATLGTVDVKSNSLLKWKARGRLEIRFGREAFPIVAPTKSGQLVLPPFLFTKVRVLARGPWTITVTPQ